MATLDLNNPYYDPNLEGSATYNQLPTQGNVETPQDFWTSQNKKRKFIHQIRDQYYYIEIWLYNQIDGQKPFAVPFMFVNSLAIEETLMDWFIKGWIVFNNSFEILERGSPGSDNKPDIVKAPYIFRTDGRNRISIKIYPIANNKTKEYGEIGNSGESLPREKWEMSFDCVIYDVEDLPTVNAQTKLRKYYFWDERYQIFLEKNIDWSTSTDYRLPDYERGMSANLALRELINSASKVDPRSNNRSAEIIKVGYLDGGSIDKPQIPLNDFWDWDYGNSADTVEKLLPNGQKISYRKDLIFYTSPANNNVIDDINYILENTISSKGYPTFLRFGRWSEEKNWSLIGLEKYFENAENEQVERIIIDDGIEASKKPYVPRAPAQLYNNDINNFMSGIASKIRQYKFSPMVAIDDNRIANTPLHQYDFSMGRFNMFYRENTAEEVINSMTDMGEMGLYSFTKNKNLGPHVLLNLNKTKKQGIMLNNMFSPKPFVPTNLPKLVMMEDALFLNETLSFIANGLTIRSPGRFLFVDKINSNESNPFDDRFLGQWMITKVVHVFTQDNYVTEVISSKIDTFSKLWPFEDTKL